MVVAVIRRTWGPPKLIHEGGRNFKLGHITHGTVILHVWSPTLCYINIRQGGSRPIFIEECPAREVVQVQFIVSRRDGERWFLQLSREKGIPDRNVIVCFSNVVDTGNADMKLQLASMEQLSKEFLIEDRPDLDWFYSRRFPRRPYAALVPKPTTVYTRPSPAGECRRCRKNAAVVMYTPCGHVPVCLMCMDGAYCVQCSQHADWHLAFYPDMVDDGCQEGRDGKRCLVCVLREKIQLVPDTKPTNDKCVTCGVAAPTVIVKPCMHLSRCRPCMSSRPHYSLCPICEGNINLEVRLEI